MDDPNQPQKKPGRAYTGDTIVMPGRKRRDDYPPAAPPPLAEPLPPRQPRRSAPRPRIRRPFWPRVRQWLLVALLLLLVACGLFYWQVRDVAQAIVVPEVRPNPPIASPLLGGTNVLLIGVDERPDHPEEGVRSDTLMLAHIDATGRWVSLLSIPRDTQVDLPDIGTTKINVAYGYGYDHAAELYGPETTSQQGGMALAAQTVEDFLDMPAGMRVHYTAQINFDGFAGLIDALGGITVDVPSLIIDEEYPTPDFGIMRVEFQPGVQRMDGATALIYARTRHADSDFGRAERQQQVLRAIVAELRAKNMLQRVAAIPGLLQSIEGTDGATPPVLTTMPIARPDVLLSGMILAAGMDPDAINQVRISPETVAVTEIGSNLIWDPEGVRAQVNQWLSRPSERVEQATVQVFNGTQVAGLAGETTFQLEQANFIVLVPDNAPPGDYPTTLVYDVTGNPVTSRRVARTLGADVRTGPPPEGFFSTADIVVVLGADVTVP